MENKISGNRIIIIGSSGSGKSTLARQLQQITGLPLFSLDNIWWNRDRTHISREEFDRRLRDILQGDAWIIDGDYSRTYETRFIACDTVIFLDFSEEDCMNGIIDRLGKARPDIPWVDQTLDPQLVALVKNYRNENRPEVYRLIENHPEKQALIFQTRKQAQDWLDHLEIHAGGVL